MTTTVQVVAASGALRRGLRSLVDSIQGFQGVGGEAHDAADPRSLGTAPADILLIEPSPGDGMPLLPLKGDGRDGPALVLLTDEPLSGWASDGAYAGVRAVLPRSASDEQIVATLQAVAAGLVVLTPEQLDGLLSAPRLDTQEGGPLTPRELDVLRMLAEGHANKAIAARLKISEHTVKFHISAILGKLHASTRTEAVTLGIRRGLVML